MWFFAVLVVLVMGGVAALAAGRGAPMVDAYDDRPDALVPRDGELGADDVRTVRFSLAFRGYRMSEVDALLDRLAVQLDAAAGPTATHSTVAEAPLTDTHQPVPEGGAQGVAQGGVPGDAAGQRPEAVTPPPDVRGDQTAP